MPSLLCWQAGESCIDTLLQNRADVNVKSASGRGVIHEAADVVQLCPHYFARLIDAHKGGLEMLRKLLASEGIMVDLQVCYMNLIQRFSYVGAVCFRMRKGGLL